MLTREMIEMFRKAQCVCQPHCGPCTRCQIADQALLALDLQEDAERYRFLKSRLDTVHQRHSFCTWLGWKPDSMEPNCDSAIDSAREARKGD
jgi:hypothetical protein